MAFETMAVIWVKDTICDRQSKIVGAHFFGWEGKADKLFRDKSNCSTDIMGLVLVVENIRNRSGWVTDSYNCCYFPRKGFSSTQIK